MEQEKPIERTAVTSSNIKAVGFCPERNCIDVEYAGGVYRYEGCTQEEFDAILAADKDDKQSVGKHIIANVKPKKFKKL